MNKPLINAVSSESLETFFPVDVDVAVVVVVVVVAVPSRMWPMTSSSPSISPSPVIHPPLTSFNSNSILKNFSISNVATFPSILQSRPFPPPFHPLLSLPPPPGVNQLCQHGETRT